MENNQRDTTLDHLRSFAMLWTILIHVLYWGDFFPSADFDLIKSYLLLEMPLLFFVTGASNGMSRDTPYGTFLWKRFSRILIPYWVFALICAVISLVDYSEQWYLLPGFITEVVLSWLIPVDRQMTQLPYLTWAVWFVPVYLCIVVLLPLLKKASRSRWKYGCMVLLLTLFFGSVFVGQDILQKVTFYSIWTYLGLFYPEIKEAVFEEKVSGFLKKVVAVGVLLIFLLYVAGNPLDMQLNKFPPNVMFLAFSYTMMALLGLLWPYLDRCFDGLMKIKVIRVFLELYATRSLTIFLYQVFLFPPVIGLCNKLLPGSTTKDAWLKTALCFALAILSCAAAAWLLGWLEDVGNMKFNRREKLNERSEDK